MVTKEFMGLFLCVNIISLVIQAVFTVRRYDAKGVSLISFIGMLLIQLLVLYNSIMLNNYLLIMVSILSIIMSITMVFLALKINYNTQDALKMLEDIIAAMPGHVYWADKNGVYLGCNDNQAISAGLKSRHEFAGKTHKDLPWIANDPATQERLTKVNQHVLATGETIFTEEMVVLPDNSEAVFLSDKRALRNTKNEIIGIVGISIDITDRKLNQALELDNKLNKQRLAEQIKFSKIADQVAHDIRSPLTSLAMITKSCVSIPENYRVILREAVSRIQDIANNFLNRYKLSENDSSAIAEPVLISVVMELLLTEKRYQYNDGGLPITFEAEFRADDENDNASFAFVKIVSSDFKRMLSNLINNAVDAIRSNHIDNGEVLVTVVTTRQNVQIVIKDNANGMPQAVRDQILLGNSITTGKSDGYGIGFSQIRETLVAANGLLDIDSGIGVGTTITLTLPRCIPPRWMATKIKLKDNAIVVILDDDASIHGAWDSRLAPLVINAPELQVKHFESGRDTIEFINALDNKDKPRVFLLTDYELLGQDVDGLAVIKDSKVFNSILVTSHYANNDVQKLAIQHETNILPKQLASVVMIRLVDKNIVEQDYENEAADIPEIVILDDDKLMLEAVRICAFENRVVHGYNTVNEFMENVHKYHRETKIVLDHNFKNSSIKGLDIAKKLKQMGFNSLYLFSGQAFYAGVVPEYITHIDKDISALKAI